MAKKITNIAEEDAMAVLQQRGAVMRASEDGVGEDAHGVVSSPITVNGWTQVDNADLPTKGKFYREVWVKPFDVKTVREVSSVDPNNALATLKSMCDILSRNCYIIDLDGNKIDGSNLKRADSLSVLLVIRAITYVDDFKLSLASPATCSVCGKQIEQIECDGASILDWPAKFDEIAKIDEQGNILYKNFKFHLPTISEVLLFITMLLSDDPSMKLDETTRSDASALLYICPAVTTTTQMHRAILEASTSMYGMNLKDIAVFRKFVQFLDKSIGTESTIDTQCPHCGGDIKIPFSVGIADICLATVEDL